MFTVRIHELADKTSLAVLCFFYLNFFIVCTVEVTCGQYLPTLSYLATFRGYDLMIVFANCVYGFLLLPVFVGFHLKVRDVLRVDELVVFVLNETAIIVLGITIAIVDEINGIEFNPVDNLHVYLSFAFSLMCFTWAYYALKYLERTKLTANQNEALQECWNYYFVAWVLYVVTVLEWHFAYTIYNGWLANTLIETVCEWSLITLALRFPSKIAKVSNYSLLILQADKKNTN